MATTKEYSRNLVFRVSQEGTSGWRPSSRVGLGFRVFWGLGD